MEPAPADAHLTHQHGTTPCKCRYVEQCMWLCAPPCPTALQPSHHPAPRAYAASSARGGGGGRSSLMCCQQPPRCRVFQGGARCSRPHPAPPPQAMALHATPATPRQHNPAGAESQEPLQLLHAPQVACTSNTTTRSRCCTPAPTMPDMAGGRWGASLQHPPPSPRPFPGEPPVHIPPVNNRPALPQVRVASVPRPEVVCGVHMATHTSEQLENPRVAQGGTLHQSVCSYGIGTAGGCVCTSLRTCQPAPLSGGRLAHPARPPPSPPHAHTPAITWPLATTTAAPGRPCYHTVLAWQRSSGRSRRRRCSHLCHDGCSSVLCRYGSRQHKATSKRCPPHPTSASPPPGGVPAGGGGATHTW